MAGVLAYVLLGSVPAQAAEIAFFADPAFVSDDSANERASLADSLGHAVTPFTGTTGAAWNAALAGAELVVVPEQSGALYLALEDEARTALRAFVLGGGGLIVNLGNSRTRDLLNGIFGFATASAFDAGPFAKTASTIGTPFDALPASLPNSNAVISMQQASLPAGTRSFYTVGTASAAFGLKVGAGHLVFLGFDWAELPTPAAWQEALGAAVEYSRRRTAPHAVAFFEDPSFVDIAEEGARALAAVSSLGHVVISLTGTTGAAWSTVLAGSDIVDVVFLPPLSGVSLATALDAEAKDVLTGFVSGGGVFVANALGGEIVALLDEVFGWSLAEGTGAAPPAIVESGAGATLFAGGPLSLSSSGPASVTVASLPADAVTLYESPGHAYVFGIPFGGGHVLWTSYGFADAVTPADWFAVVAAACGDVPANALFLEQLGAANADFAITVPVSDEGRVTDARLRYRRGGGVGFTEIALTESAPGSWTGTLPATAMSYLGVQYYVELTAGFGTTTRPRGAPGGSRYANVAVHADEVLVQQAQPLYALAGVALTPDDPDPLAVFDEFGGRYDPTSWRYGTYDALEGVYREPGQGAETVAPGRGFWLIARESTPIRASGTSPDLSGGFTVTLLPGFNLVANPYGFPIASSLVELSPDVEPNFIGWSDQRYVPQEGALLPAHGYWIKNNGALTTIRFPAVALDAPREPIHVADDPRAIWTASLCAVAGEFADVGALGIRADATARRDAFDLSDPPDPPGGFVSIASQGAGGERLMRDFRAPSESGGVRWEVLVRSDQAGASYRVDVERAGDIPEGFAWIAIESGGARRVDLSREGSFGGFVASEAFSIVWTLALGPAEWADAVQQALHAHVTEFALAAPRPNPMRRPAGAVFDLSVPREGGVTAVVYDVTGRRVRTLVDESLSPGVHHLYWNGDDSFGRRAGAGVYFIAVRARDFSASRKVTVLH